MSKKTRGGRPARVPGEVSARVSAAIRPRYKELIEKIAKDREVTVSDAIELAIIKYAEATPVYKNDGKGNIYQARPENVRARGYYIDLVRPENEALYRVYDAIDLSGFFISTNLDSSSETPASMYSPEKEIPKDQFNALYYSWYKALHEAHKEGPLKQQRFDKALITLTDRIPLYRYFNPELLSTAMSLDWMEDLPVETTTNNILVILAFVQSCLVPTKRELLPENFFKFIESIKRTDITYTELQDILRTLKYNEMLTPPKKDNFIEDILLTISRWFEKDHIVFYEYLQGKNLVLTDVSVGIKNYRRYDPTQRTYVPVDVYAYLKEIDPSNHSREK